MKNEIKMFLVSDIKPKDIIYVQLNSFKQTKQKDTVIDFYLIIEDVDKVVQYFKDLESETFHLHFIEAKDFQFKINPPFKTYLYYVRCLAPSIFKEFDKIIYVDTDVIAINNGIEDLWNIDISNKYLAAAIDIEESYRDQAQRINVGKDSENNNYLNSGVMVMNLAKWREDGYDRIFEQYLLSWPKDLKPILMDQTLLNYVFKQGVKIISSKYNNSIFACVKMDEVHYWRYYGTQNIKDKLNDAVLIHYKGIKPWNGCLSPFQQWQLPYRQMGKQIYFQLYHQLAKQEEF